MGASGGADSAVVSEGGPGAAAVSVGGDAEDSLRAAVLQPERPGDGGHAVRDRVGAAVRGAAFDGSAAGRDDDSELSAPAGAARAGAWFVRGDQRAPGGAGLPGAGGDDRGREHHRGAVIDEEPGGGAGSGDASDEEGQRVALRDEGAHRGGRGDGTGAWRAGDAGEHARSSGDGGVASRRRGGGVGGRGLPGGSRSGWTREAVRCSGMWR